MGRVFGNDKLKVKTRQGPPSYVKGVDKSKERQTDLIQLITEVYWVDIIAFQVGEHDDLLENKDN